VPFDPAKVSRTVVGTATFTFADGNAATFAYTLKGVTQTKSISRQSFVPPAGTVCGEPYRTPAPVTIVAAGDIAECGSAPAAASAAARTAALIGADDSLVLTLGDNAYEKGKPAEFANCFQPTWGAFKDRIHPSPGNHDYETSGAGGYFGYFGAQAGPDRRGYYSFDYASWHFISLNSQIDVSVESEQYRWLIADLAQSRDSLCTIAYWHYPAFNSGAKHGSIEAMKPFFDAVQAAGVEIVLSGHEHIYERFAPQRADGTADPARGVREFIVGTGGAGLYAIGHPLPNSEFRDNTTFGVLRLTLDQGTYSWRFMPVGGGEAIDSGTGTCHP
jgi:3',5'-cyclic AMP phosphodiesterase CpdA